MCYPLVMSSASQYPGVYPETIRSMDHLNALPRHQEDLRHYLAATDDAPEVTLSSLTPAECGRLALTIAACEYPPTGADVHDVNEVIGPVDYCIIYQDPMSTSMVRRISDIVTNFSLRRKTLFADFPATGYSPAYRRSINQSTSPDTLRGKNSNQMPALFARSPYFDPNTRNPVIRSMGITQEDAPADYLVTRREFGQQIDNLKSKLDEQLYTAPNATLLENVGTQVILESLWIGTAERQQHRDISTIAANAVKRHPHQEVRVGVLMDVRHDEVAKTILKNPDLGSGQLTYVPAHRDGMYLHSRYWQTSHERSKSAVSTYVKRQHCLFEQYLTHALEGMYGNQTIARRTAPLLQERIPVKDMWDLLATIDLIKGENEGTVAHPDTTDRNRGLIHEVILSYLDNEHLLT